MPKFPTDSNAPKDFKDVVLGLDKIRRPLGQGVLDLLIKNPNGFGPAHLLGVF